MQMPQPKYFFAAHLQENIITLHYNQVLIVLLPKISQVVKFEEISRYALNVLTILHIDLFLLNVLTILHIDLFLLNVVTRRLISSLQAVSFARKAQLYSECALNDL